MPVEARNEFEKAISLRTIDNSWVEHINTMEHLREGINLRGWSGANPLQAYTLEGFEAFEKMMSEIDAKISVLLLKIEIRTNIERKQTLKGQASDGKEKAKSTPKRVNKIGRNDPCPCGSGKKYKQCCGK
jgi:preprotein translocase subunit SecA